MAQTQGNFDDSLDLAELSLGPEPMCVSEVYAANQADFDNWMESIDWREMYQYYWELEYEWGGDYGE